MFMQSAAMALGFGSFFQYGKRKISSMSNEEFNVLTPEALTAQLMSSVNNMIPTVEQSFHQMEQMNVMILEAMAKYFDQATTFLFKWLKGGASQAATNFQEGGEQFASDIGLTSFLDSGGQLLPSAGAEDSPVDNAITKLPTTITYNANERYAQRWLNPQKKIANLGSTTFKEISFLLKLRADGKLFPKWSTLGTILLREYNAKKPTPPTEKETVDVITKVATGDVQKIALMYNKIKFFLERAKYLTTQRGRSSAAATLIRAKQKRDETSALTLMKEYNRFVQSIRKANLTIDTAKSLAAFRIIPKT